MSKIKTLFENHWLSLKEKTLDNGSTYVYAHAPWSGGSGVAILPFRQKLVNPAWNYYEAEFLGRYEICPAHSDDIELCSITGGMDKDGESPVFTAMRELIEEGGYEVPIENIVYLGEVKPSKASDTTNHLFAVDLDKGCKEVIATGDGTVGEEGAYCNWITTKELVFAKDPLLQAMYARGKMKGLWK